jgi:hypothetical protein
VAFLRLCPCPFIKFFVLNENANHATSVTRSCPSRKETSPFPRRAIRGLLITADGIYIFSAPDL